MVVLFPRVCRIKKLFKSMYKERGKEKYSERRGWRRNGKNKMKCIAK